MPLPYSRVLSKLPYKLKLVVIIFGFGASPGISLPNLWAS